MAATTGGKKFIRSLINNELIVDACGLTAKRLVLTRATWLETRQQLKLEKQCGESPSAMVIQKWRNNREARNLEPPNAATDAGCFVSCRIRFNKTALLNDLPKLLINPVTMQLEAAFYICI